MARVYRGMVPATHEVTNQPPPLLPYDVFAADVALVAAVRRHGGGHAQPRLSALGRLAGSPEAAQWAWEADRNPPVLRTHDRYGHRVDEVDFHPSWHRLLQVATEHGLAGGAWAAEDPAGHVVRAAGFLVWSQVEAGHGCPVSMTHAAVPALRADRDLAPDLAATWLPRLTATAYDPGLRPAGQKAGCLAGMGMTEKQGGSDVATNTTRARPAGGGGYLLTGHKWFCSAPMSDGFLVLAQAPEGLTCFLLPRVLPDGTRNTFRIQRLKDKLGNRANASAEVELEDSVAWRLGPEGRGVRTIITMVAMTRLDCVLGSAALQRRALTEALHHATHRRAFGRLLRDQPLMRAVLADLALESEAATVLGLRLAAAVDAAAALLSGANGAGPADRQEAALLRLALPAAKYWVCKRTPPAVAEALECLGGNGYVEESGLPRLYREAPVNSIWEGSGNVNALDVLRALRREPQAREALQAELAAAWGGDPRLDAAVRDLDGRLDAVGTAADEVAQAGARELAERIAVTLQAALLVRHAPAAVADAFCATRLGPGSGRAFGTLPGGVDTAALLDRAGPPG